MVTRLKVQQVAVVVLMLVVKMVILIQVNHSIMQETVEMVNHPFLILGGQTLEHI